MLRNASKLVYYSALQFSGAGRRRMARLMTEHKAAILNLHRVSPHASDYWPPLDPNLFEDLVCFLKEKFHICTIEELGKITTDKPLAVLSFDDGYYDFIEYALPIIEKHRLPVNMNVVPECAVTGKPIWNVRLYDFLHASSREEINRLEIPGWSAKLESDHPAARVRFGILLSRHLKNRSRNERLEIWRSIEPRIDSVEIESTRMMSTEEIRQISERVEIGAHSFSHESMGFESDEFFEDDIHRCREFFTNELDLELSIYAFPNGSYRAEQIDYLRGSGIRKVLLVDEELADAGSDVLTRLTMYGDSAPEVKMRALGF